MMRRPLLWLALPLGLLPHPLAAAPAWDIQDTSEIGFTAYQKGQPVRGGFQDFEITVELEPDDPADSRIEVAIDVSSITTGHGDRDQALRSATFFNAKEWPTATFVSESVTATGVGAYEAAGTLTIRDVTQDVTLPFTLEIAPHPDDPDRLLAEAAGDLTISRLAYGVGQGDFASTSTVGDEVDIQIRIDATRPR